MLFDITPLIGRCGCNDYRHLRLLRALSPVERAKARSFWTVGRGNAGVATGAGPVLGSYSTDPFSKGRGERAKIGVPPGVPYGRTPHTRVKNQ